MAMGDGGYFTSNVYFPTTTTSASTTTSFVTYQPTPIVVSQQPHIVAFPADDLAEESPMSWLRRRVDEVCEEAWAA